MSSSVPITLAQVNAADRAAFVAMLDGVFERSRWIALRAHAGQPFASVAALHRAMMDCVRKAGRAEQLELVRAHPEIGGQEATAQALTPASTGEQKRLGFDALAPGELAHMADLNRRYRERFGFPCIVALRLHETRTAVLREMERRVGHTPEQELQIALDQIAEIARGRLEQRIGGPAWAA